MNINAKDARQPGCSAEKRGRFIPCRGGGTATTYYTDYHDVDEDVRTISGCGGQWVFTIRTGVASRDLYDSSTTSKGYVASRLIYLS